MKNLRLSLICLMLWLPFSSISVAKCVSIGGLHGQGRGPESHVLYFHRDWVGDAIHRGGFYASGDIYMDYDYLMANQSKGLQFDQLGSLYFLPPVSQLDIPDFDGFSKTYDVAYTTDKPAIDYWITADSNLDVDYFFSRGDIYIVNGMGATPVPLPASGGLSAAALFTLLAFRRKRA